jgi:hypothetical protein
MVMLEGCAQPTVLLLVLTAKNASPVIALIQVTSTAKLKNIAGVA